MDCLGNPAEYFHGMEIKGSISVEEYLEIAVKSLLLFWFMLIMGFASVVHAEADRPTLVVAFSESAPWKILNESQQYTGIDMDILTRLAELNNLRLLVKPAPLIRCLEMMKTGAADIISNIKKTPDRHAYLSYLNVPYQTHSNKVFYQRMDSPLQIQQYEDLYGLDIGVKRGARYFPRFDLDTSLRKYDVPSMLSNFKKLDMGRLDLVISTESEGDYVLKHFGLQNKFKKADYRYDSPMDIYFAMSKKSRLLAYSAALETSLQQMLANGEVEQIIARYQ